MLRSLSDDPFITEHREMVHKIGVTGGSIEKRIANAKRDPTYLLAPVEVVASYKLYGINRVSLERLLHHFFLDAKLNIALTDRFSLPVSPKEWFFLPLHIIDQAISSALDGTLHLYRFDLTSCSLVSCALNRG